MRSLLMGLFLIPLAWGNNVVTKVVKIDGSQENLQFELENIIKEGTGWIDVEVPDTCYRNQTVTVTGTCYRDETQSSVQTCTREENYPEASTCYREENYEIVQTCYRNETYRKPRTCYRNATDTTPQTCYRSETSKECRTIREAYCRGKACYPAEQECKEITRKVPYNCEQVTTNRVPYRCDEVLTRQVPYQCNSVATRKVPYQCNQTRTRSIEYPCNRTVTRKVPYSCPTTQNRSVPYECTRSERREVPLYDIAAKHIFYLQLNLGNNPDLSEKLELKADGAIGSVKQLGATKYILEPLPISSREESTRYGKIIYHDVIIDINPK